MDPILILVPALTSKPYPVLLEALAHPLQVCPAIVIAEVNEPVLTEPPEFMIDWPMLSLEIELFTLDAVIAVVMFWVLTEVTPYKRTPPIVLLCTEPLLLVMLESMAPVVSVVPANKVIVPMVQLLTP